MLTVPVVFNVPVDDPDEDDDEPDAERKSDLMNPFVPLCLTLDQSPCVPVTSTLVFADSVLIILWLVDAPDLKLTALVVFNVPVDPDDEDPDDPDEDDVVPAALPSPPRVRKSDLIKPFLPPTFTFDQPAGLCSVTSILVPFSTVATTLESVDADDLTLTPAVAVKFAVLLIGNFKKSDLINPVELPTFTLDHPAGL